VSVKQAEVGLARAIDDAEQYRALAGGGPLLIPQPITPSPGTLEVVISIPTIEAWEEFQSNFQELDKQIRKALGGQ